MKVLYPPIKAYQTHALEVGQGHTLYVEEAGNANGLPVIFVHGGPGGGCSADDRRFFDPEKYHIILFDQRGCGRSTPFCSLKNNTTPDLIEDMERIRQTLKVKQWVVFGGSWGSTLGLAYAQAHPDKVKGLILRGIFLGRKQDYDWLFQSGASRVFPDHWQEFIMHIPEQEQEDLVDAYYRRLHGEDELLRMSAAKHWSQWEGHCATLNPCAKVMAKFSDPHVAMSIAIMETHYFKNHCFVNHEQLLHQAYLLEKIPGFIIHGRYDMVCPVDNAYALNQAWPSSELFIVRDAGHASSEPGIIDALVNATDQMAQLLW